MSTNPLCSAWWRPVGVTLLALFLAAPPVARALPSGDVLQGMANLSRGRPRMAAHSFRQGLEKNPDDAEARAGLVDAYRDLNRCGEIVEHGPLLEGTRYWKPSVMVALAACAIDVGDWAEAHRLLDEAIDRRTQVHEPLMVLADLCVLQNDLACLDHAWAEALNRNRGPALVAAHQAKLAVLAGDPEGQAHVEALLAYSFLEDVRDTIARQEVWLAVDDRACVDVQELSASLVSSDPSDQDVAALRGEALRRCGDLTTARASLDRPAVGNRADNLAMAVVRARLLVDERRAEDAAEVLKGLPPHDPRVVASRWYVARALGDSALMADLEEAWAAHHFYGQRSLDELIPLAL